ncbi:protein bric-a-brac 2-like isoform X3 [Nymphalis io]|uniref:protein bric-a-brac 2-like isoform X3 n=1 Tax=Inachis io TaxID=171585 RepID=UPI00216906AE|nr:protein bric-a-brac 2-like isoform X3 [Nymphalis io]
MLETQFSLSWEQHMYNISYGLNKFRQNGEFVDMTLAADGYFIKAHQMILSLVSPYIKDIIGSLQCTHPVIFLDNVSYKTLCSILDYVYKGEVQVSKEQLDDLIKAGKVLQIKGLQEMNSQPTSSNLPTYSIDPSVASESINSPEDKNDILPTKSETLVESEDQSSLVQYVAKNEFTNNQNFVENAEFDQNQEMQSQYCDGTVKKPASIDSNDVQNSSFIINQDTNDFPTPFFTISNQGSLQLVLNRHLYFLKYKSTSASGHSQWKCVNYINTKCPAYVITKNDKVIQKHIRHEHPYHDIKIAKKVASGEMFSSMRNAEEFAKTKKDAKCRHNRLK